jgi:hypothetical protein
LCTPFFKTSFLVTINRVFRLPLSFSFATISSILNTKKTFDC